MTTTISDKPKKIKASLGFVRLSDTDLLKRLDAIHVGMTDNPAFPNPPVDMATFKTAIDSYSALTTDAIDGGQKAISAKHKQRDVVVKLATQLGHYVEAATIYDLATFNTSGFVPVTYARTPQQPLPPAAIKWVDRGPTSGSVVVKVTTIPKAIAYELRYSVLTGGTPGNWTTLTLPSPKPATVNNLMPGATYVFQVRALGKLGYTDWSDSTNDIYRWRLRRRSTACLRLVWQFRDWHFIRALRRRGKTQALVRGIDSDATDASILTAEVQ